MRAAAATVGFFDFMIANSKSGRLTYTVEKEVDFTTSLRAGPYRRSNVAAAVARFRRRRRQIGRLPRGFRPLCALRRRPFAFMAAPIIDQGIVIGVLIAQLSTRDRQRPDRQPPLASGRIRRYGRGLPCWAGISGALRAAGVLRESRGLLRRAQGRWCLGRGDRRHPALRDAGAASAHRHRSNQAGARRRRGHGRDHRLRGVPTLASWGPLAIPGVNWALVAKSDIAEAFAPIYKLRQDLMVVGGLALLVVLATAAWLSSSLLGPMRELTAGVKRFAAGDYEAKVPVRTRDEIGQLCSAFNGMVEDLREKNVIEDKNRENEQLLLNVLPAPIANRLRGGEAGSPTASPKSRSPSRTSSASPR